MACPGDERWAGPPRRKRRRLSGAHSSACDWPPVLLFQQGQSRQTIVPASFERAVPLWVAGQNSDTKIIMQTRANRYSIRRPLEFAVRNGTASTKGQGRTVNISRGGVLFQSDGELSLGGRIELVVRLAEGAEADTFVTLFVQGVTVRSDGGGTAVAIKRHRLRVMPSDESKLR